MKKRQFHKADRLLKHMEELAGTGGTMRGRAHSLNTVR